MTLSLRWTCLSILLVLFAQSTGMAEDDAEARLARAPRPWKEPIHRLTLEEYSETLRYWAEKYPQIMKLETRAQSKEGLPIFLVKITDPSVSDDDKQVLLVTGMHSGAERSGTAAMLHFMEWLLGDSPDAVETRRKQIVLLMPVVNPWGFFTTESNANSQGIDPYSGQRGKAWDIEKLTVREPEKAPEIMAYKSVVDEFKPDVHVDLHGVSLWWNGQLTIESAGTAYSNFSLRPWDWRITEAMIAGARKAGYGIDRGEADSQRMFWGPDMQPIADRLWLGRPFFYTATYGYAMYHTLPITMEVNWNESALARLKALLAIGNGTWEGESVPGYPVNVMKSVVGQWIVSCGRNAAERRRSRIELWQRQGGFTLGILYPQTDCRASLAVAITAKGAALLDPNPDKFLANLEACPGFDVRALRAFVKVGPEKKLYFEKAEKPPQDRPLGTGLALRLRIPYRGLDLCDLRLNGHLLNESPTDGFQRWYGDGFTHVQINVPPDKARKADLLFITCAYAPDVQRHSGWQPPDKVLSRIKGAKTK